MKFAKSFFYVSLGIFLSCIIWLVLVYQGQSWVTEQSENPPSTTKPTPPTEKQPKKEAESIKPKSTLLSTMNGFFPTKKEDEHVYIGMAEYGYRFVFKEEKKSKTENQYTYVGTLMDGRGEDDAKGPRTFILTYKIKNDVITEEIQNRDYWDQRENTLNSIIPNFIILKGELKTGEKWNQSFQYKEATYVAETEVTKVNGDLFETTTHVNNIEGYYEKHYIEIREYRKGYGLIGFSNSIEGYNGEDLFGYSLQYIRRGDENIFYKK